MKIIKPNSKDQSPLKDSTTIFLAGSIEMGAAEDWQDRTQKLLSDHNVTFYNPRRDDWDSSWKQSITDPQFNHQVNWEMDHLEKADIIFLYFSPETKSPISLLELGLHAKDDIIVCCPEGFWRKGNVEIVCDRNQIPFYTSFKEAVSALKSYVIAKQLK